MTDKADNRLNVIKKTCQCLALNTHASNTTTNLDFEHFEI